MNLVHARSYGKINAHLNKTQTLYTVYVLNNREGHLYGSQVEFFLWKIDNESIYIYSSGKRFHIFGPR